MTCVAVLGAGAVGARVARRLLASDAVDRIVLRDIEPDRLASASRALGSRVVVEHAPFPGHLEADLVVVASPRGTQVEATAATIEAGRPAVLVGDGLAETVSVLRLANEAARAGVPVAVGSGFGPGLSCVLAVHAAAWFDGATQHEGSWWPDWHNWLQSHNDKQVTSPKPGKHKSYPVVEDAPGSYVKRRLG